ncbi:DUF4153 domain-containing protein [Lipingzhangella sp. LS1_29]|uniref:DUF4153 domain-containing protein n=1 Tax=Lipingzhangella rawalii TaxID=2055835 RepID=A0ABU2H5K0_9ACTN|nr:DUF4153 domain-containing protein [Lipingzhangella rawalii]MDS1270120.1 DUF4153 domain-containing protein [Lipingzhangella rawalii]
MTGESHENEPAKDEPTEPAPHTAAINPDPGAPVSAEAEQDPAPEASGDNHGDGMATGESDPASTAAPDVSEEATAWAGAQTPPGWHDSAGSPQPHGTTPPPGHEPRSDSPAYGPPWPMPAPRPRPPLPETPRWLLPAALVAGLLAAVLVPAARPGVGVTLAAVTVMLVVARGAAHRACVWSMLFGLVTVGLVAVPTLRDAQWLAVPSLLLAGGLASLAVSGAGRHWFGLLWGSFSVLRALGSVPRFLAAPLQTPEARRTWVPLVGGLAAAVVLVAVFGLLFAWADAVFAELLRGFLTPDRPGSAALNVVVFLAAVLVAGAGVLVGAWPVADSRLRPRTTGPSRALWLIPLASVNVLFAMFVAVQAPRLFGGHATVQDVTGLIYADYAREGFFQLVVVAVLVLALVALARWLVPRERVTDHRMLTVLLGVLCVLTIIVLASALHRIDLYVDMFGFTRTRAMVFGAILWILAVFLLTLTAGVRDLWGHGVTWFPRAVALATGVGMLVFVAWNPDARIAESLETREVATVDAWYVSGLSADALPVVAGLPEPARSCALGSMNDRLERDEPATAWNHARSQARELLDGLYWTDPAGLDCPTHWQDGDMDRREY